MNRFRAAAVVARRDFMAIVATPTFLVFLLAPLLMISLSGIGGMTAALLADNAGASERMIAQVGETERAAFVAEDARLRTLITGQPPARLIVMPADGPHGTALAAARRNPEILAILTGTAARPVIAEREANSAAGRYLTLLADSVARGRTDNSASTPRRETLGTTAGTSRSTQAALGYGVVFVIFLLILLLGGQTVGTLAEEKGNKIIEILAAAVPMESVFYGKLFGMLGVALLFIAFWGVIGGVGATVAIDYFAPRADVLLATTPAVGWPLFLLFALTYFLMGFMLLGAIFLGLGALASSVREIQMLSLPITLFQVGMFSLGSAAANLPGTTIATIAQWLPWSSPYAMAARGATDAALWPHLIALAWQVGWLVISVALAVRLFRFGVLRSGPLIPWLARRRPIAVETD
jgi:ABC-2 type transport system permease protein